MKNKNKTNNLKDSDKLKILKTNDDLIIKNNKEIGATDIKELVDYCAKNDISLRRANLSRADLNRANLIGANLFGANLFMSDLLGADLLGADLTGADLRGTDLEGADLKGAYFWGAFMTKDDLSKIRNDLTEEQIKNIIVVY